MDISQSSSSRSPPGGKGFLNTMTDLSSPTNGQQDSRYLTVPSNFLVQPPSSPLHSVDYRKLELLEQRMGRSSSFASPPPNNTSNHNQEKTIVNENSNNKENQFNVLTTSTSNFGNQFKLAATEDASSMEHEVITSDSDEVGFRGSYEEYLILN
jgi:hypothetical protein